MPNTAKIGASLAALLVLSASLPALAQGAVQTPDGVITGPPKVVYDQRDDPAYREQQKNYQAGRETYLIQQDRYRHDREAYLAARADYDTQYGPGSYDRYRTDWYKSYSDSPCERGQRGNQATGGVIGALAGAAVGSNVAARNARTEGALLGALVGGALGAGVGKATAKCDSRGYYYDYTETVPYDEGPGYGEVSGRYGRVAYLRQRCRLASAPAYFDGVTDYRYVRVCPDGRGRYRFTG